MANRTTDTPTCDNPPLSRPQVPEATGFVRLSERDVAEILAAAENPPAPNTAALQAAQRLSQHRG